MFLKLWSVRKVLGIRLRLSVAPTHLAVVGGPTPPLRMVTVRVPLYLFPHVLSVSLLRETAFKEARAVAFILRRELVRFAALKKCECII